MKTRVKNRWTRLGSGVMSAAVAAFIAISPAAADESSRGTVLLIDRVTRTAHIPVPTIGQSMDQVKQTFGQPDVTHGAVGDPPITRWVYAEFTVYFESNRVIHAVVNKASDSESLD